MEPKFKLFDFVFHKDDSLKRPWIIWNLRSCWGAIYYDIRLWQGDPSIPKTGAVDINDVHQFNLNRVPDLYWTLYDKHG